MKSRGFQSIIVASFFCCLSVALWLLLTDAPNPVALLRVVDKAGNPIAGAIIRPEGIRTKPGPYAGNWYNWGVSGNKIPDSPVTTDPQGCARVPYPKYVFERIETGTLTLSVEHPRFVPERPECRVAFIPPAGAPWRVWLTYAIDRIRAKALITSTDPIVLQEGAVLSVSLAPGSGPALGAPLTAQVSSLAMDATNFWVNPSPQILTTKRLRPGLTMLRPVRFDTNGMAWFGAVTSFNAVGGQTNELSVELRPGVAVRGRLDESVPRPIRDGRFIAQIWPKDIP